MNLKRKATGIDFEIENYTHFVSNKECGALIAILTHQLLQEDKQNDKNSKTLMLKNDRGEAVLLVTLL